MDEPATEGLDGMSELVGALIGYAVGGVIVAIASVLYFRRLWR